MAAQFSPEKLALTTGGSEGTTDGERQSAVSCLPSCLYWLLPHANREPESESG